MVDAGAWTAHGSDLRCAARALIVRREDRVAPTRNPRALSRGEVERQQREPSPRDSPPMATELLLLLMLMLSLSWLSLLLTLPYVFLCLGREP